MSSTTKRFLRRFTDMFSSPLDAVRQTLILGMIGMECKLLLDTTQWTDSAYPKCLTHSATRNAILYVAEAVKAFEPQ